MGRAKRISAVQVLFSRQRHREESIFCQADADATTESVICVDLILLIAVVLLLSVPCELGKESKLCASWPVGFKYLQVLSVDILFCIAW